MGAIIRMYVEKLSRVGRETKWSLVTFPGETGAILDDWSGNDLMEVLPLTEPRGLPEDLSREIAARDELVRETERQPDRGAHEASASWLLLAELLELDWPAPDPDDEDDNRVAFARDVLPALKKVGDLGEVRVVWFYF